MNVVCVYMGRPDECPECGGMYEGAAKFCSHDCGASWADRGAAHERERHARRDADAAYGAEVDRLRQLGHTDTEIDAMLRNMP